MKLPTDRWNRNIDAYSDESFLKSIYQKNYTTIEQYILKNSGTVDDAKDIYQEAFLSVWRNIQMGKFIPENSSAVSAYLYIVAKNKWIDYLRSASFRLQSSISNEDFLAGGAKEESTEEDILFEQSILKVKEAHTADSILHFTCTPTTDSLTLILFIEHQQNALYEIDDIKVYQLDSIQIDTIHQFTFVDSSAVDVWRNSFSSSELDTMILSNTSYDTTGARMKVEMIVSYDDDDNENMSGAVYRRLYHLEEGNEYNIRFVLQTDGVSEIDSVEMILIRSSLFDAGFPNPDTILVVGHSQDTLEMNFVAKESEMIFAISARKASTTPYHYYVDEYSMRQKWVTKITCPPGNFHYAHENYRFGFGGQEQDSEIYGNGNSYTAEFWQYDPRLGRRWNVDPILYPFHGGYTSLNNNPIRFTDPTGLYSTEKKANKAREKEIAKGYDPGEVYQSGKVWGYNSDKPRKKSNVFEVNFQIGKKDEIKSKIKKVWDSREVRNITGDVLTISYGASGKGGAGAYGGVNVSWILHGKDASIYPYANVSGGGVVGSKASLGAEVTFTKTHGLTDDLNEMNANYLLSGMSVELSTGIGLNEALMLQLILAGAMGVDENNESITMSKKMGVTVGVGFSVIPIFDITYGVGWSSKPVQLKPKNRKK